MNGSEFLLLSSVIYIMLGKTIRDDLITQMKLIHYLVKFVRSLLLLVMCRRISSQKRIILDNEKH